MQQRNHKDRVQKTIITVSIWTTEIVDVW